MIAKIHLKIKLWHNKICFSFQGRRNKTRKLQRSWRGFNIRI